MTGARRERLGTWTCEAPADPDRKFLGQPKWADSMQRKHGVAVGGGWGAPGPCLGGYVSSTSRRRATKRSYDFDWTLAAGASNSPSSIAFLTISGPSDSV